MPSGALAEHGRSRRQRPRRRPRTVRQTPGGGLPAFAFLTGAVLAFSGGWASGQLVLDGPGVSLYVRLALDHMGRGAIPYWMPDMWAGSPVWALIPSLPILVLLPIARLIGPDQAVRMATVFFQIAGAWGAFVLARSLWGRRTPAPLVAGLLYGLHPILVSHGALLGLEPAVGVMAVAPWLVWSFRLALRGRGPQYVALAGLLSGLAVLHHAEHAYGLVLLCVPLLALALTNARARREPPVGVLVRAGVVVSIGAGTIAYWLLPFLALGRSFYLSPPELVQPFLLENPLSHDPGAFLRRSVSLTEPVMFLRTPLLNGTFYLSWTCLALALAGVVLLVRRDADGTMSAILCSSAFAVLLSTGAIPLASSGIAQPGAILLFVAVGVLSGLVIGNFAGCLGLRRSAGLGAAVVIALACMPYVAPFLALQRIVPFLSTMRFPRFYPIAALGLALGAAYPITVLRVWAASRGPRRAAALLPWALSIAVMGIFIVDISPYRSLYRLRRADSAAFSGVSDALTAGGTTWRAATDRSAIPEDVSRILESGMALSVGWPHVTAGEGLWPITMSALNGPVGFRDHALGLSATKYLVKERVTAPGQGPPALLDVQLEVNPAVLPLVRAYEQAVVLGDTSVAPVLAASLAPKGVVTVAGHGPDASALAGVPGLVDGRAQSCGNAGTTTVAAPLAGELARACSLKSWIGSEAGQASLDPPGAGAFFRADANGLRGVSVWLDRLPAASELILHEVADDGHTLGPEVLRAPAAGIDENQMAKYEFTPISASVGRRYAFLLSCTGCTAADEPAMFQALPPRGQSGNSIVDGRPNRRRDGAFTLEYDRFPPGTQPTTSVQVSTRQAGRWRIQSVGGRPAMIVVAESYFPGWKARVDGDAVAVLRADGSFLGVPVGAGTHTIELEYHRPTAALAGRVVTAATLAAALLLLTAPVRRRRRQAGAPRR